MLFVIVYFRISDEPGSFKHQQKTDYVKRRQFDNKLLTLSRDPFLLLLLLYINYVIMFVRVQLYLSREYGRID